MSTPRQTLYQRLPEIYRIKDEEQRPAGQMAAYLGVMDEVLAGMRDNIEALYHDFFIETCDDWVVAYLADLLGTSHLSGDPWTLRADVARTVFHRRRKGTLGAVESIAYTLSGWAAHAVELRNRLVWNQHLNHQRPDAGGQPPLRLRNDITSAVRGGTVTLRDPALLTFLGGAFDPFAHLADLKPGSIGPPRYNLPNLGIFLWRLKDYLVPLADPGWTETADIAGAAAGEAAAVARCILQPLGDPMVLFNTHRYRADDDPPNLSHPDEVPGPMPWPRLSDDSPHGNSPAYVRLDPYGASGPAAPGADSPGLALHVPDSIAPPVGAAWRFRGANLCAWEDGLRPPLRPYEIAVDPTLGRVLFGLADRATEADPLVDGLFVSYTYGFSGPVGAHPVSRAAAPALWNEVATLVRPVNRQGVPNTLEQALGNLGGLTSPLIVEIQDSGTYRLDLSAVAGIGSEGGHPALTLGRSLWIRAATGQRPVLVLEQPLRFRPADVTSPGAAAMIRGMDVRLEGLYLTWNRTSAAFAGAEALIEQAAVNRLEITGCTLDPGGARQLDGTAEGVRQAMRNSLGLGADYGFLDEGDELSAFEELAFDQEPEIAIKDSIAGALRIDAGYRLDLANAIVDGGSGVNDSPASLAVGSLSDPADGWGPSVEVSGLTCFGRMRVTRVNGQGAVWVHRLEAHDNQAGCVKFSYFSGDADRLPPHHACVFGTAADLSFASEVFGQAGYAQVRLRSDPRILEQGPGRDAMGAFGFLKNTHKWKNISIRFREFMPVGIRPVLIPVT